MLTVSCLTAFANPKRDLSDFTHTLAALRVQTHPLHEIIVMDDAPNEDKSGIAALCEQYTATHMPFSFLNWAIAGSRQYNQAFARSTGEILLLLCPHWVLAPDWVAKMLAWLIELGPGNLVSTTNDRHHLPRAEGGPPEDWFADYPMCFLTTEWQLFDHAKVLLYRQDWLPFDEDFDCPEDDLSGEHGSNHGLVYWAWQQQRQGRQLWLRRDMQMEHAKDTHSPAILEKSRIRHDWSYAIYQGKIGRAT